MKHPTHWTDQPSTLEDAEPLLRFFANGFAFEVRRMMDIGIERWFVSMGTLFGSQTIEVPRAVDAFRAVDVANNAASKGEELPIGDFPEWKIVPNT